VCGQRHREGHHDRRDRAPSQDRRRRCKKKRHARRARRVESPGRSSSRRTFRRRWRSCSPLVVMASGSSGHWPAAFSTELLIHRDLCSIAMCQKAARDVAMRRACPRWSETSCVFLKQTTQHSSTSLARLLALALLAFVGGRLVNLALVGPDRLNRPRGLIRRRHAKRLSLSSPKRRYFFLGGLGGLPGREPGSRLAS
jgi:hypothetical protein